MTGQVAQLLMQTMPVLGVAGGSWPCEVTPPGSKSSALKIPALSTNGDTKELNLRQFQLIFFFMMFQLA
ncbi:hypothetical protein EUGRSUZ_C00669 [Eucalyptus grandis]|uniref:Uncharacterized protein n=2 Tax=Eucalyptus grandis TaxID=71139 RepID=A0ACC3LAS5_EUCGR|nr:hypothetical protein EUGRSUZ_C00669 [Eucalyptus grandis]